MKKKVSIFSLLIFAGVGIGFGQFFYVGQPSFYTEMWEGPSGSLLENNTYQNKIVEAKVSSIRTFKDHKKAGKYLASEVQYDEKGNMKSVVSYTHKGKIRSKSERTHFPQHSVSFARGMTIFVCR